MKHGEAYVTQSQAEYEALQRQRTLKSLQRRARHLGLQLLVASTGELLGA